MATITHEPMEITLIENTTMTKILRDGVLYGHSITPNEGYVLHSNTRDWTEIDPDTDEEITFLGYSRGSAQVINYDFDNRVNGYDGDTPVVKVGRLELYAILESLVPADQIFGVGNNDHEIM